MNEKQSRFVTLDGMRGLAALVVLLHHCSSDAVELTPSGYLAVDFFFLLSGFVIARAYEDRLGRDVSLRQFVIIRVIRMWPLYLIGLLFGIARVAAQVAAGRSTSLSVQELVGASLLGAFFLPSPVTPFYSPFNGAAWSLYLELAVNVVYAAVLARARSALLWLVIAASGAVLVYGAVATGKLDVGYSWSTIHIGIARVAFSFTVGVVFSRLHRSSTENTAVVALLSAALIGMLVLRWWDRSRIVYDLAAVLLLCPLLVWLGASFEPSAAWRRPMLAIGELSYPVYAIHWPITVAASSLARHAGLAPMLWIPVCVVSTTAAAYLFYRFWDQPARSFLTARLLRAPGHRAGKLSRSALPG